MADNNIDLTATFDTSDATKGVKNFGEAAEKSIDVVNDSVDKLQKNISDTSKQRLTLETTPASRALEILKGSLLATGAAIAAAFTVGAVKSFFSAIIDESIDAENNLNQLNASLQRAGTYSTESSQAMQDFAGALMAVSTADDDVILGQLAIARNFAKSDEQARQLVKAALDLSAATGESLDTSVEQLGKTLDGTAGRLNETVPALRGLSEEALKSGKAIEVVAEQFGGAATSKLETFEGAVISSKNRLGNLLASLGDYITKNPIVIEAINETSKAFGVATDKVSESREGITKLINDSLVKMISVLRSTLPVLSVFDYAWDLIKWSVSLVVDSIKNLIDVFKIMYEALAGLGMLMNGFSGEARNSADAIKKSWDSLITRTDKLGASFSNIVKPDIFNRFNDFDTALKKIQDAAEKKPIELKTKVTAPTKGELDKVGEETQNNTPTIEVKTSQTKENKEFTDQLKRQNELFEKFIGDLAKLPAKLISGAGKGAPGAQQVVPDVLSGLAGAAGSGIGAALGGPIGAAIGEGIGSFMGEIIKLAQGSKDEIAAKIDEFFNAIPEVLDNIVENLPMVVEKVMTNLPGTVVKIVEAIPDIIMAFVNGLDELAYALTLNSPAIAQVVLEIPIVIIKAATLAMVNIVKGFAQGLARLVNEKWNEAIRVMTEKLLAIPTAVGNFFNGIADFFKGLSFNDAKESVTNAALDLQNGAIDFFNELKGKLKIDLPSFDFSSVVQALADGVGSLFSIDTVNKVVDAIIDGFNRIFDQIKIDEERFKLGGTGGQLLGEIGGAVKRVLGLAKGGVVPTGFPNDTYPAMLTSNEVVVPADTTGNLFSLINDLAQGDAPVGQNNDETNALLKQLINIMANQQKVIEVKVERDTLAKAIVSLNKDNRRLA